MRVCFCAFASLVFITDVYALSFMAISFRNVCPGFTFPRLLQLSYDDKVCFPIRVQLVHLLRSLHISPAIVSESAAVLGAAAIATTSSAGGTAAVGRYVACPWHAHPPNECISLSPSHCFSHAYSAPHDKYRVCC